MTVKNGIELSWQSRCRNMSGETTRSLFGVMLNKTPHTVYNIFYKYMKNIWVTTSFDITSVAYTLSNSDWSETSSPKKYLEIATFSRRLFSLIQTLHKSHWCKKTSSWLEIFFYGLFLQKSKNVFIFLETVSEVLTLQGTRDLTVQMGISKAYKGYPFQMLLFAHRRFPFSRNYILPLFLQWNLSITTTYWDTSLPSGAHLGGQGPPRWATEGRNCYQE